MSTRQSASSHPSTSPRRRRSAFGVALLAAFALAAPLAGCSKTAPPAQTAVNASASTGTPPQAAGPAKGDVATPTSGSIHIDEKILKACGDVPVAHFPFDSARIEGQADLALTALARCFVSGPLKGKGMRLVGHADPRGETEYNIALGQRRAGSVDDYLASKGLEKPRIKTLSRGALDATGSDEGGWARDRKVEVFLDD